MPLRPSSIRGPPIRHIFIRRLPTQREPIHLHTAHAAHVLTAKPHMAHIHTTRFHLAHTTSLYKAHIHAAHAYTAHAHTAHGHTGNANATRFHTAHAPTGTKPTNNQPAKFVAQELTLGTLFPWRRRMMRPHSHFRKRLHP